MSKVDLSNLAPGTAPLIRGAVVFKDNHGGPSAQSWPRKRPDWASSPMQPWCTRFGFAAVMAANPNAIDLACAIGLAKGTEQVPRDLLTQAALGRMWIITNEDGTEWGHVQGPTYTPPAPPAREGNMWEWTNFASIRNGTASTTAAPFKGNLLTPKTDLVLKGVRGVANFPGIGTYAAVAAALNGSNEITDITYSDNVAVSAAGNQLIGFAIDAALAAGQRYAIMWGSRDRGDTYTPDQLYTTTLGWAHPSTLGNDAYIAKASPAVGDIVTIGGAAYFNMAMLFEND